MTLYGLDEFIFLCELAGFRTFGELKKFMRKNGIRTWLEAYRKLDALCFPDFQ